ncbi:hypothetical protein GCM10009626_17600 [Brachybacterium sacelli]
MCRRAPVTGVHDYAADDPVAADGTGDGTGRGTVSSQVRSADSTVKRRSRAR